MQFDYSENYDSIDMISEERHPKSLLPRTILFIGIVYFTFYVHNIHSLSNDIHTHLIKAVAHEDKVGTAESKLCNEQKQIHSKPIPK